MTVANVNVTKVLLKRGNTSQNNNYTGVSGEVTIDTQAVTLRIHDGITAGGNVINAGGVAGSYSNVNAAAYLTSQSITSANIGAFQVYANANAASQTTEIDSLRANITAANTVISGLTSNAAIQAALLDTLTGNAATQSTVLDTLTSNAATQTNTLTTLLANAVSQETSLISLLGNAATQATLINSQANLSGATFTGNVTVPYLFANNNVHIDGYVLVGSEHDQGILYKNPAAIFFGNTYNSASDKYFQLNLQNTDPAGSGDIVITADDGTDTSNYIAIGINGSSYLDPSFPEQPGSSPHDGYIYMTGGNLVMLAADGNIVIGSNIGGLMSTNSADNSWDISGNLTLADNVLGQANNSSNLGADFAYFKNSYVGNVYATTVTTGNILPSANVTYSLGNATHQWKDLWVSNNTIYIGNTPIRVDSGTLLINGAPVGGSYSNANVSAYLPTYTGNIAGNIVKNGYTWTFGTGGNLTVPANGIITAPNAQEFQLQARDTNSLLRNEINLDPNNGTYMSVWSDGTTSFSSADWDTGSWNNESGLGAARFTDAQALQNFWTTGIGSLGLPIEASINGGARTPNVFYENNNGETYGVYLGLDAVPPGGQGTTVPITSLVFYYQTQSKINIDRDGGEILLDAQSMDIDLRTTNILDLRAGENLNLRGLGAYPVRIYTNDSTHMWEFDTAGSLTLPSQGKIYGIGAPNDRPGYISWAGNSSGDGSGYNTMRLVPDQQGLEDLDTYIILDPAYVDGPGSIHIRAGGTRDNSLANLYLGGANSHVKIGTGVNPPVTLLANNRSWTFGNTGTTQFPDGTILAPAGQNITMQSDQYAQLMWQNANQTVAPDMAVMSNFYVAQNNATLDIVYRDGSSNQQQKSWLWGVDGSLTLPAGGTITEGGGISGAIRLTPAGGANADQALLIYPTAGGDGDHIHLTAGGGTTELYLGSDLHYVKLVDGGNVEIRTDDLSGNVGTWNFGANANLTLPETGYLRVGTGIVAGFASSPAPVISGFSSISAENFRFQGNGVNILSAVGAGSYGDANVATYLPSYTGNIAGNIVKNGYTWTFGNTGTTTFPTGVTLSNARGPNTVNFLTGVDKSFQIETQTNATSKLWNFTTDGNLTLPQNANINFANGVNILSTITAGSTYSNVNVEAYIGGNIGAFQTYANANAATQATSISTINNTLTSSNVGIGAGAGSESQGDLAVAVGSGAGSLNQGLYSVAIGNDAGADNQGDRSVAVGTGAGRTNQGNYAVAIGRNAGYTNQGNNSIIINATTGTLNQTTANTFTVAPVRNDVSNVAQVLFYNTTNKEITYGNTINIAGNINAAQYNFANGVNILSTVGAGAYGNADVATYLLQFDGDIEFTSSTAKIGNVDVITVMDNIQSPAYRFSNGASIFDGITGTYSNTNVAAYLTTATITTTGNITAGNLSVSGNLTVDNTLVNRVYLLEAYADVTYTLPGSFTEDPCRYSVVSANVNVPSAWFNTSTYTFAPQKAGYWEITASYDVYRNGEASMAIKKNNSIVAAAGSFNAVAQQVTKIIYLNGSTDSANVVNVGGAALQRSQYDGRSWFQARWVGA